MILKSEGHLISFHAHDDILIRYGFAPLPRLPLQEKLSAQIPPLLFPPQSGSLVMTPEIFATERGVGPLIFLPLLEKLGIVKAIQFVPFPYTQKLTEVSSIRSILALKSGGLLNQKLRNQLRIEHLNQLGLSIVVKVDFDLTMSERSHNRYRVLSQNLPGLEQGTVPTLYRKFMENGVKIQIEEDLITVKLKKKTHRPILFELLWMNEKTPLSWMGINLQFKVDTTS
jgi:hypothetical protein